MWGTEEEELAASATPDPVEAVLHSDTVRAEGFSDGVLAIIITLLVLDLFPIEHKRGELLDALLSQWPTYLAYLMSYLYVGVVWLNHKAAFRRIDRADPGLHWLNLLVLFATAWLPFPTAVLADALQVRDLTDERIAIGLYAVFGAFLCISWWAFFQYLSRHPELLAEGVDAGFFRRERTRAWLGLICYILAPIFGLVFVPIALVIFLALPIYFAVTSHGLDALPSFVHKVAVTHPLAHAPRKLRGNGEGGVVVARADATSLRREWNPVSRWVSESARYGLRARRGTGGP
jgi:uncharacterized membrane protein